MIGSERAVLNLPKGKAYASVILMPGGHGYLDISANGKIRSLRGNQLIRTRKYYARSGVASLSVDANTNLPQAIAYMRKIARPVVVVATSRGATRAHRALPGQPDGLVLTSAMLDEFRGNVGSASKLPRTLVIHNKYDGCWVTPPEAVSPFKKWGGAKVRVVWFRGGRDVGNPCKARGFHGFAGQDRKVVRSIVSFARSLR